MRGKWDFIDMINGGGLLALLTRFSLGFFNEGGDLGSGSTSIRANNTNKVINIRYNAQAHVQLYMMMFMVLMC